MSHWIIPKFKNRYNDYGHSDVTMLLELHRLMGLDPSTPLYVDRSNRTVLPEIVQTLDDNTVRTVVTRIP